MSDARARRHLKAWLPVAAVSGLIWFLTLVPSANTGSFGPGLCLLCGQRALADALLNLILFLPLGMVLYAALRAFRPGVLTAAAMSALIEVIQIWVPGRDSNPRDFLFNTAGAALGAWLVYTMPYWTAPVRRRRRRIAFALLSLSLITLAISAALLTPHLPRTAYYGQWTPRFEHLAWYRGEVLDVRVGARHVPSWRVADSDALRSLLRDGAPIEVDFIAGPPVRSLAPIFSIADDGLRSIRSIGIDGDDAVLRFRTWASAVRLDEPTLRVHDAFASVRSGDTVSLVMRAIGDAWCLVMDRRSECGIGYALSDTWGVLFHADGWPSWLSRSTGLLWLAGLFAPAGFFLRSRGELLAGGAIMLAGISVIPYVAPVLPVSLLELAGAAAGFALASGGHRFVRLPSDGGTAS